MTEVEQKEIEELNKGISELAESLDLAQARIRLLEREVENLKNIILKNDKKDYMKGLMYD